MNDDKEEANEYFRKVAKPLAKDLENWIPTDGTTEADNTPIFKCEGMKQQALIAIGWEGNQDSYTFKLIVDGEERMQSNDREELRAEAERIGAELTETHTP